MTHKVVVAAGRVLPVRRVAGNIRGGKDISAVIQKASGSHEVMTIRPFSESTWISKK
jgi:hypothetical protein